MDAFLNILVENLNRWHQNSQRARKNTAGALKSHNPKLNTFQRLFKSKAILKTVISAGGAAPLLQYFGYLHPSDTLWLLWNKWGFKFGDLSIICYYKALRPTP